MRLGLSDPSNEAVGIEGLNPEHQSTFMNYDLGYFDDETCRLEPIDNPFGPKVLPMSPE
jgi:putative transposase